jgi:hypothetical protein
VRIYSMIVLNFHICSIIEAYTFNFRVRIVANI